MLRLVCERCGSMIALEDVIAQVGQPCPYCEKANHSPEKLTGGITIREIIHTTTSRAIRWHPGGVADWSALEWAGAMTGESGEVHEAVELLILAGYLSKHGGEAANAAKKLKRVEQGIANINEAGRQVTSVEQARKKVGKEVADVILYAVLLAVRAGYTAEQFEFELAETFNVKSREYGFPERLFATTASPAAGWQEQLALVEQVSKAARTNKEDQ